MQIDYDPTLVTYDDLLSVFWQSHRPTVPAPSRQYASFIFADGEVQLASAEASKRALEERFGRLQTGVVPLTRFYVAEDYHQKYFLRQNRRLFPEFDAVYPDPAALRESTAAARVNGYLDGAGTRTELEAEIGSFGLSADGEKALRAAVGGSVPAWLKAGVR